MEELAVVENYLRFGRYPDAYSKGEKANLRRKCHNNYQFNNGVLYYRRAIKSNKSKQEEENWRVCVRADEEKRRILESCHARAEGKLLLYSCKLFMVDELSGGHLGRDKTIEKIMSRFYWKDMNGEMQPLHSMLPVEKTSGSFNLTKAECAHI